MQPHAWLKKAYFLLFCILVLLLTYILGLSLLGGFLFISLVLYVIYSSGPARKHERQTYLVLTLLFFLFILAAKKITEHRLPAFYIPIAALTMLTAILYNDLELTFLLCLLASAFSGLIAPGSLNLSLMLFFGGIISGILAQKQRIRIGIFNAGFYAGAIQMFAFMIVFKAGIMQALPNLISGIYSAAIAIAALPLLENVFGIVTNYSLLELSDFNHPLIKKMILEAPGTYHHSLIVGNLAEAAAQSIGANSLLTRIGAYYHDIGKLVKSEYFMENQGETSKHSGLAPSISKMVIMNHVKEGVELAKKHHLKPAIIDFVTQHHGTSLVYYFYRRALEEIEDQRVQEEVFRYPGPKPTTKETAIVLLADSVEAAARVMGSESSAAKIEDLVHKIINNKFIDGQLDNCDLTLKDLEEIAKVFIRMLGGIYHGRIKYPEEPKERNTNKEHDQRSAAHHPERDKKNNRRDS